MRRVMRQSACHLFLFFKQKTAYEIPKRDWSSDVCSSDLIAATDTISSRTAKVGDAFTARVMSDVKDVSGQVVIPAGSTVHGTVTAVKPAPNPRTPGTLTLSVSNVTVRGTSYPIEAAIDSVQTTTKGRGVTTGDAA